ncbi:hypothetical protein NH287_07680 [Microbacterium sp. CnD16-F]|uniref:hypothetical protein n=1 Tax=Microbacterium sp. CnD16-F TaxID=2954493 RepID=UPI002098203A|nr:hypothetical protein [Microbacterium sp. CnD16-F]MCO7203371.1 hypothetical protein [Microbacterium sp. CnD16-F]
MELPGGCATPVIPQRPDDVHASSSIDAAIELARSERERVDDEALMSREMAVGEASWPSWEIEIHDLVYLWVSMPDHDVYATGDRAFVSSQIEIIVPA